MNTTSHDCCPKCSRLHVTNDDKERLRHHAHVCDCSECSVLCWARIEHDREWECDGRVVDWKARAEALERELDRWRHGVTIEGDFVCPDSIALTVVRSEIESIRARLTAAESFHAVAVQQRDTAWRECEQLRAELVRWKKIGSL